MALDLDAVVRAVGGECVSQQINDATLVDGLTVLDEYVVVGNPEYATLVTGEPEALAARLEADTADRQALLKAVFVTEADTVELRGYLQRHGMTAILGTAVASAALHARLAALIAEHQAAVDRLVTAGMKVLTQVARRGGTSAVIVELARQVDGWAVLLDANGQLIASAGAGRLHINDAAAFALGRPVRVRHRGLQTHQVGSDSDLVGYLVLSSRSRSVSRSRDLGQQAAALCDLLLRTHNPSLTDSLGREALLVTLLQGGPSAATLLRRWGVHETSLTGFALGSRSRTVDLDRLVARWLDELGAEHVYAGEPGLITGFVRDDLIAELAARVDAFTPVGLNHVNLGLGASVPVDVLDRSEAQARQALRSAIESGQPVMRYTEFPTVELVFEALSADATLQVASVLDPLRDPSGSHGLLTETLRVFLAEHGGHRASARALEIHRQTLASRIQRIEALTGLSMDRADDRAAAWLALRAVGR